MGKRLPRLQFAEEQSAQEPDDVVHKAGHKPAKEQESVGEKVCGIDANGSLTTQLCFESDRKKPPSKLTHVVTTVPADVAMASVHREVRESEEDNVGVESAHIIEEAAERGVRGCASAHRTHQLKTHRSASYTQESSDQTKQQEGGKDKSQVPSSTSQSRQQQKRAIKKDYAAAKSGKTTTGTNHVSEATAAAEKKAEETTRKIGKYIVRHKGRILIWGAVTLMVVFLLNIASSCSVMVQGGIAAIGATTYPSDDSDMLAAEAQYCAMEAELQAFLDEYESSHNYDEYVFEVDEINHDPYVLISAITALHGGAWTIDEVGSTIQMLFDHQYILAENVSTEIRYRTQIETEQREYRDPNTGRIEIVEYEREEEVPYNAQICTVTLENFNLSHVPVYIMSDQQLSMYATYMRTLGNRPDLFPDSVYINAYFNPDYQDYEIPPEALADEQFAAMIKEAEKYLGYPYVWGGSSPATSFDCSGFVSWVVNHCGVGWNVGRLDAESLRQTCVRVSPANVKPGDLIFFQGTYDTVGASHVGIYVGNNMMIHCGDPIQYASISSSYWQAHFMSFGRLPNP